MYRIAVIPGDGIGPEVVREGLKVLEAATASTEVRYLFIGLYFLLSVGLLFQRERRRDFFEIVFSSPFPKRD